MLQWLVRQQEDTQKAMQSLQQSSQVKRQGLLTWQAKLQKSLQEQASVQQLLQRMASPMVGDGIRAQDDVIWARQVTQLHSSPLSSS